VLVVEEGELDVDRYIEGVSRARHLHQLGDPALAAATYVEAERLWTGDPWADLGGRFWAIASVERLTTRRATAAAELGACMLETDNPAAALEQVRPLLQMHPRRDDLRRIEMLALHRLGRSVEASRVYQLHRNMMIEQTGLEPSRELAELEAQILRDDPALAATGPIVRGFELLERLAETAEGAVWRARQPSLDREVRLTIIQTDLANDPEFIRYFEPRSACSPRSTTRRWARSWTPGAITGEPTLCHRCHCRWPTLPVALLLAAEAYRRSLSPETLGVIQRVMLETGPLLGQRLAGVDTRAVRWLDDDRLVALSAESVVLFSSSTGEIFDQAPFELPDDDPLISVRFYEPKIAVDPAGRQVAVTAAGGTVEFFEASGDRLVKTASILVGFPIRSLAFAPDGVDVYAGDANGSVHEIDLIEQEVTPSWEVFEGPGWKVPDGYSTGDMRPELAGWLNQNGVTSVYVTDEFVAAVGGSQISVWDREARTVLWSDYAVDPSLGESEGKPVLVFPRWIGGSGENRNELHLTGPIDLVGSIDAVTGLQQWRRNKGLTGFSFVAFGVETVFDGELGVSVAEDGAVRKIDPVSGTLHGEVLPVMTDRPAGMDLAPGGRTAAVATRTGVTVIAIDGSGLLNDAFPVTVRPDELTIASGGLVAGTASYSTEAVTVFDRTDAGFEQRVLDSQRSPTLVNLSGLQTGDPRLGVESRLAEDGTHSIRVIDTRTLEPISDWLHDAAAVLAIDHDNGIQYVRHELENERRPNGDHLFRIYRWPNGPEATQPIEVPTGEVGAYPRIVLEGGRLVVGTNPLPARCGHSTWIEVNWLTLLSPLTPVCTKSATDRTGAASSSPGSTA